MTQYEGPVWAASYDDAHARRGRGSRGLLRARLHNLCILCALRIAAHMDAPIGIRLFCHMYGGGVILTVLWVCMGKPICGLSFCSVRVGIRGTNMH